MADKKIRLTAAVRRGLQRVHRYAEADAMDSEGDTSMTEKDRRELWRALQWLEQVAYRDVRAAAQLAKGAEKV